MIVMLCRVTSSQDKDVTSLEVELVGGSQVLPAQITNY